MRVSSALRAYFFTVMTVFGAVFSLAPALPFGMWLHRWSVPRLLSAAAGVPNDRWQGRWDKHDAKAIARLATLMLWTSLGCTFCFMGVAVHAPESMRVVALAVSPAVAFVCVAIPIVPRMRMHAGLAQDDTTEEPDIARRISGLVIAAAPIVLLAARLLSRASSADFSSTLWTWLPLTFALMTLSLCAGAVIVTQEQSPAPRNVHTAFAYVAVIVALVASIAGVGSRMTASPMGPCPHIDAQCTTTEVIEGVETPIGRGGSLRMRHDAHSITVARFDGGGAGRIAVPDARPIKRVFANECGNMIMLAELNEGEACAIVDMNGVRQDDGFLRRLGNTHALVWLVIAAMIIGGVAVYSRSAKR